MLLEHDATASSSPVLETKAEKLFKGRKSPSDYITPSDLRPSSSDAEEIRCTRSSCPWASSMRFTDALLPTGALTRERALENIVGTAGG